MNSLTLIRQIGAIAEQNVSLAKQTTSLVHIDDNVKKVLIVQLAIVFLGSPQ
jgi:hypothetical protein